MRQVDPAIYSGVDRAERRRIAKELAKVRELRADSLSEAARLRSLKSPKVARPFWAPAPPNQLQEKDDRIELLARDIAGAVRVPLTLFACAGCHRPVPLCTCVDSEGNPLSWNTA